MCDAEGEPAGTYALTSGNTLDARITTRYDGDMRNATATRTNRFAAKCATCAVLVPAEQGSLERVDGAWKVYHIGACPAPAKKTITAVTLGVYRHDGRIFVVKPSRRNKGRVYACELVESPPRVTEAGTEIPFELVFRPGAIYDLDESERMTLAEAEQIATRYARCFVCNTGLKAAKSVREGIGPVCRKYFAVPVPAPRAAAEAVA